MAWCSKCDNYMVFPPCRCKPFDVREAEVDLRGDIREFYEPVIVHALTAEKAAESFLERRFNDSACETTGCLVLIDGQLFDCEAEPSVSFNARESRRKIPDGVRGLP